MKKPKHRTFDLPKVTCSVEVRVRSLDPDSLAPPLQALNHPSVTVGPINSVTKTILEHAFFFFTSLIIFFGCAFGGRLAPSKHRRSIKFWLRHRLYQFMVWAAVRRCPLSNAFSSTDVKIPFHICPCKKWILCLLKIFIFQSWAFTYFKASFPTEFFVCKLPVCFFSFSELVRFFFPGSWLGRGLLVAQLLIYSYILEIQLRICI